MFENVDNMRGIRGQGVTAAGPPVQATQVMGAPQAVPQMIAPAQQMLAPQAAPGANRLVGPGQGSVGPQANRLRGPVVPLGYGR